MRSSLPKPKEKSPVEDKVLLGSPLRSNPISRDKEIDIGFIHSPKKFAHIEENPIYFHSKSSALQWRTILYLKRHQDLGNMQTLNDMGTMKQLQS